MVWLDDRDTEWYDYMTGTLTPFNLMQTPPTGGSAVCIKGDYGMIDSCVLLSITPSQSDQSVINDDKCIHVHMSTCQHVTVLMILKSFI